jgi:hypothetical protein
VQFCLDPLPTAMMRLQLKALQAYRAAHDRSVLEDLTDRDQEGEERFVGWFRSTVWMTAFASLSFNQVRTAVIGKQILLELTDEDVDARLKGSCGCSPGITGPTTTASRLRYTRVR